MKTNKVNPLTAFRKLTETRQTKVKKSMKKAQDGIETNDDMINKSGYGAKKSTFFEKANLKKYMPWEGPVELINPADEKLSNYMKPTMEYADPRMNPNYNPKPDAKKYEGPKALSARMAAMKQKKGGSVKRKK